MTPTTKTPRLGEAIKEFNVGRETLVEFLVDKGFDIKNPNPGTKLTEQLYNALQIEFAPDKAAKRKSEEIALPKGSLLEGIRKTKEDLDLTVKDKKEEAPVAEPKVKPKEEKPKEPEKPKAAEVKEEPAKKAAPVAVNEDAVPAKEAGPESKKAEDKPKATAKAKAAKEEVTDTAPEHLDVKAPR